MTILKQLFFLILLVSGNLLATPQVSDLIIIENDTLLLRTLPLETYLDQNNINLEEILDEYGFTLSTACYRRYQALWELKNDSLFILNVNDCNDDKKLNLDLIFPNRVKNRILAEWFSDTLLIAYGKQIHYEHWGWGAYYENEKEIILTKGIVQEIIEYDNSNSHVSKYENNGKLLQRFLSSKINWDNIPRLDGQKRVVVSFIPDEDSVKVSIIWSDDIRLNPEALRVVKQIDDWTRIYSRGKLILYEESIPLVFKEENRLK